MHIAFPSLSRILKNILEHKVWEWEEARASLKSQPGKAWMHPTLSCRRIGGMAGAVQRQEPCSSLDIKGVDSTQTLKKTWPWIFHTSFLPPNKPTCLQQTP